jgi:hypothetical protein
VDGNDLGNAGIASVDTEGEASAEAAGGSANEGKTSGSIDSCACAETIAAKKIPATKARVKRGILMAKPEHMAARLECRQNGVNEKIVIKNR